MINYIIPEKNIPESQFERFEDEHILSHNKLII
jgi:hypothetical protein